MMKLLVFALLVVVFVSGSVAAPCTATRTGQLLTTTDNANNLLNPTSSTARVLGGPLQLHLTLSLPASRSVDVLFLVDNSRYVSPAVIESLQNADSINNFISSFTSSQDVHFGLYTYSNATTCLPSLDAGLKLHLGAWPSSVFATATSDYLLSNTHIAPTCANGGGRAVRAGTATLAASLIAATSPSVGWRSDAYRVIVVVSDAAYTVSGNEKAAATSLLSASILPIFAVPQSAKNSYDALVSALTFGVVSVQNDWSSAYVRIATAVRTSSTSITTRAIDPQTLITLLSPASASLTTLPATVNVWVTLQRTSQVNVTSDIKIVVPGWTSATIIPQFNLAPIAQSVVLTVERNSSAPVVISGDDADGDSLFVEIVTLPASGTLYTNSSRLAAAKIGDVLPLPDGSVVPYLYYAPRINYTGTDIFQFRLTDGCLTHTNNNNNAPLAVTIMVYLPTTMTTTSLPPTAVNMNATIVGSTVTVITLEVTDPQSYGQTVSIVRWPTRGRLARNDNTLITPTNPALSNERRIRFTPEVGYVGPLTISFQSRSQAYLTSNIANLSINVTPAQVITSPPVFTSVRTYSVKKDTSVQVLLAAEAKQGSYSITILSAPTVGDLIITDGVYTHTLNNGNNNDNTTFPLTLNTTTKGYTAVYSAAGVVGKNVSSFNVQVVDALGVASGVVNIVFSFYAINALPVITSSRYIGHNTIEVGYTAWSVITSPLLVTANSSSEICVTAQWTVSDVDSLAGNLSTLLLGLPKNGTLYRNSDKTGALVANDKLVASGAGGLFSATYCTRNKTTDKFVIAAADDVYIAASQTVSIQIVDCTCGGQGYCNAQMQCVCKTGWTGDKCTVCDVDYYGPSCTYCTRSETCSNNGNCTSTGTCACDPTHYGTNCSTPNPTVRPTRPATTPTIPPTLPPTDAPTATVVPTAEPTEPSLEYGVSVTVTKLSATEVFVKWEVTATVANLTTTTKKRNVDVVVDGREYLFVVQIATVGSSTPTTNVVSNGTATNTTIKSLMPKQDYNITVYCFVDGDIFTSSNFVFTTDDAPTTTSILILAEPSKPLSSGNAAAIAMACILVVAIAVFVIIFLHKKQEKKERDMQEIPDDEESDAKAYKKQKMAPKEVDEEKYNMAAPLVPLKLDYGIVATPLPPPKKKKPQPPPTKKKVKTEPPSIQLTKKPKQQPQQQPQQQPEQQPAQKPVQPPVQQQQPQQQLQPPQQPHTPQQQQRSPQLQAAQPHASPLQTRQSPAQLRTAASSSTPNPTQRKTLVIPKPESYSSSSDDYSSSSGSDDDDGTKSNSESEKSARSARSASSKSSRSSRDSRSSRASSKDSRSARSRSRSSDSSRSSRSNRSGTKSSDSRSSRSRSNSSDSRSSRSRSNSSDSRSSRSDDESRSSSYTSTDDDRPVVPKPSAKRSSM